jgi:hypothetical protein
VLQARRHNHSPRLPQMRHPPCNHRLRDVVCHPHRAPSFPPSDANPLPIEVCTAQMHQDLLKDMAILLHRRHLHIATRARLTLVGSLFQEQHNPTSLWASLVSVNTPPMRLDSSLEAYRLGLTANPVALLDPWNRIEDHNTMDWEGEVPMEDLKKGGGHWASLRDPIRQRFWVGLHRLHQKEIVLLRYTLYHDLSLARLASSTRQLVLQTLHAVYGGTQPL